MIKLRVDELLKQYGMSVKQLAKEIGYPYGNLNKIINGSTQQLTFRVIEKMCRYFSCTPNDIIVIYNEYDKSLDEKEIMIKSKINKLNEELAEVIKKKYNNYYDNLHMKPKY